MIVRFLITFLILMIYPFLLIAQDTKPTTSALTFEVLSTSLQMSKEPQNIRIIISCNGSQDIESLTLKMTQIKALWSVVSAKLNNQPLWLIKSENMSNKDDVLAWNLSAQDSELILFPNEWSTPYVMELEIQLNLNDPKISQKEASTNITMEASMAGESYHCSPTGRGNQLSVQ